MLITDLQMKGGTGKEIIANAIHNLSEQKDSSNVTLNCPVIPKRLEEAGFFGNARGAYTGAYCSKNGISAAADGQHFF